MGRSDAKTNRVGERFTTNEGYEIVIVEYNSNKNVWVEFQDEHKARVHTQYGNCEIGNVKNPYHPSVYGVGYLGVGKYKCKINGKHTKEYNEWCSMLERCYSEKIKAKYPTYTNCSVAKEWHNFQNYCKWQEDNYYEIEGEKMHLDKDILCKGNKIYVPDKCIFVPERINILFTKSDARRGKFPIGVSYYKASGKYRAQCTTLEGKKHLGYFDTPKEAFLAYKQFKETYIKQIADEYKGCIPDRLYEAMYKWEIEIDD